MVSVIITCAGKGARANFKQNKLLEKIDGKTVIEKTFDCFFDSGLIDEYIITASKEDYQTVLELFNGKATVVLGGDSRTKSVRNGLDKVTGKIVLIHDGARPFVSKEIIKDCIESVKTFGSGISAYPTTDTVLLANGEEIEKVLGKDGIYIVATPQGFFTKDVVKAYSLACEDFPDDSSIYAKFIGKPHISLGNKQNVKLTYKEDFEKDFVTGVGFDCHKLTENRKLILGGVEIPYEKGLLGHSDADVLTHAIMDAMLSACAMRDIGYHFSDKDAKYKDISSMVLLSEVLEMVKNKGYAVKNLSAVIMAEKPKMLPHIPTITENLAKAVGVDKNFIGITATTLEGLGFVGREEGICVHANVLLTKIL